MTKRFWIFWGACLALVSSVTAYATLPWEPEFSITVDAGATWKGQPISISDVDEWRLYCDGATSPTFTAFGGSIVIKAPAGTFGTGAHSCVATMVIDGEESEVSDAVPFDVPSESVPAPILDVR